LSDLITISPHSVMTELCSGVMDLPMPTPLPLPLPLPTPLPTQDTLSWHHLSKEQVTKGIIMQLHEGCLPYVIITLIWNEIKRSQEADEEATRSYHSSVYRLRPRQRRLFISGTWGSSWEPFLDSILIVGNKDFLQAEYPSGCGRQGGAAGIRSKCLYLSKRGHSTIMSDYNYFVSFGFSQNNNRAHHMCFKPSLGWGVPCPHDEYYVEENWATIEAMSFGCLHIP